MGKREDMEIPTVTMTYKELGSQTLANFIKKIERADVTAQTACRFHQIVKNVKKAVIAVEDEYIETIQKPYKKKILERMGLDVDGPIPPGESLTPEQKEIMKELNAEFDGMLNPFHEKTIDIEVMPLGPQHIAEIKLSAAEIEALGPLIDLTGDVRTEAFQRKLGVIPNKKA